MVARSYHRMKSLSLLTFSVTGLLFSASSFAAGSSELSYYTTDTTTPMTDYQIADLCQQQTNTVQASLTEISTRLTGNATTLQVIGYYGQTPSTTGPVNSTNPQIESYCYLTFKSNDPKVLFNSFVAVEYTHLNSTTWDTACKPAYDQLVADPNTLITDYDKTATLFQGRICDVEAVQAVVQQ